MPEHYVITISRQFGSLGRPIAQKAAQMLGIYFMDRDIVEETSRRMGLLASEIGDREESARNAYYYMKFPLGIAPQSIEDEIFSVQSSIIRDCAAKQNCIIVGRCAEYVLREKKRRLSFYIRASYESRLNNCVEQLHLKSSDAQRMIHDVDLARARYRRRYVKNLEGISEYTDCDIVLDSGRLGVDKTAELIVSSARAVLGI
ncbi:cytidylate kinase-like family protein [Chordicoccus furentiruminis]|uniref:cytidylate kinase-like family protein n=1 Tax=Chordicoccus furentiruminis TaxID=2709410 RepID=UPI0023A81ADA|nr:cytidylate kinase-like family protein [Chordicoccus furentiruminis]